MDTSAKHKKELLVSLSQAAQTKGGLRCTHATEARLSVTTTLWKLLSTLVIKLPRGALTLQIYNEQKLVAKSPVRVRLRPPMGPLCQLQEFEIKANCVSVATGARGLGRVCLARSPWRQEAPPRRKEGLPGRALQRMEA